MKNGSAVEQMLEGDEIVVQRLAHEAGPLVAGQFVRLYNNACLQTAGFEEHLHELTGQSGLFYAPLHNFSWVSN